MIVIYFLLSTLTLINARPQEPNPASCQPDHLDLIPHMWDCTKYYNCQNGLREPEEKECAAGTQFSFIVQACVNTNEASCTSNLVEFENILAKESYDEAVLSTDECPSGSSVYLLFPHESDCALYYQCVHGRKVLRQCAPGTHFDVKYQRCNWPWAAGCELGGGEDSEIIESEEDGEDNEGGGEDGEDSGEDGGESEDDGGGGEDSDENGEDNGEGEGNGDSEEGGEDGEAESGEDSEESEENGDVCSNETDSKDDSDENDNSKSSEENSSEENSSAEDDKNMSSLSVGVGVNLQMSKFLKN